jgi:DNA/RNA endonuclease YhcR with UshA esterase domain
MHMKEKLMKEWNVRPLIVFGLILICSTGAMQAQRQGRGKGIPEYDQTSVVSVTGAVQAVSESAGPGGWAGTHFILQAQDGPIEVHLGPSAFLAQENFKLTAGEQVQVTGSKIKYQNADLVIAREVKVGDKVLQLRDDRGYPKWSRGRRNC